MRILVKGAGVAGLAAAYELAAGGAEVVVADTSPALGGGASWLAGGMLAPWCEAANADRAMVALGRTAADWWEAALPGEVRREGTLVLAPPRDTGELQHFAARTEAHEHLDAEAIARLEPDLAGRFRSGLFFGAEAHLDPRAALRSLQRKLSAIGVRFAFGADETMSAEGFDRVIDCTGIAALDRLDGLRGVRGEMLYLATEEIRLSRPVRLIHPRTPAYIVPRGDGRFMVGATMIESGDGGPASARSVMELLNAAYTLHPAFGEARIVEIGVGVRPSFPDNLPRIVECDGALFVNGLHRHGFLLAPAMAQRAAAIVFKNQVTEIETDEAHRQRRGARGEGRNARRPAAGTGL